MLFSFACKTISSQASPPAAFTRPSVLPSSSPDAANQSSSSLLFKRTTAATAETAGGSPITRGGGGEKVVGESEGHRFSPPASAARLSSSLSTAPPGALLSRAFSIPQPSVVLSNFFKQNDREGTEQNTPSRERLLLLLPTLEVLS